MIQNYWDSAATPDLGYETNNDGKLMSHMTVIVDKEGYPADGSNKDERKWVYVEEQQCIGCTLCQAAAPGTFFMEEEYNRARVYQQSNDTEDVVQTAIDSCPVDCISRNTWFELVTEEMRRLD
jgi:ferredoxin